MESIPLRKKILETIVSKSTLKQKVFDNTFATFNDLKETLLEMIGIRPYAIWKRQISQRRRW